MENDEEMPKYLFNASGLRQPEFWQHIKYIAPAAKHPTGSKWKYADSIGTFCEICQKQINYDPKTNPTAVKRHAMNCHKHLVAQYLTNKSNKRPPLPTMNPPMANFHNAKKKQQRRTPSVTTSASPTEQKKMDRLCALWTSISLRPCAIVEDEILQEMIDLAGSCSGKLQLPNQHENRDNIMMLATELKENMDKDIRTHCLYFAMTADIRSLSRRQGAFITCAFHFLTKDFQLRDYTLEVKQFVGGDTNELVKACLQETFHNWQLDGLLLTLLVRDSGSTIVKVCDEWGIDHIPSFGHILHLIVGPFLVIPNKVRPSDGDNQVFQNDSENLRCDSDDEDGFLDSYDDEYANTNVVLRMRDLVQKLKNTFTFIQNSTKRIELLEQLQNDLADHKSSSKVRIAGRTRWNSTLAILMKLVKFSESIDHFLSFYNSAAGKAVFHDSKIKLQLLNGEDWSLAEGLIHLLSIFQKATEILSGVNYLTYSSSLPILRTIKNYIADDNLFNYDEAYLTRKKRRFKDLYGDLPVFNNITDKLDICRKLLFEEFNKRFSGLHISMVWVSLLDPRYGLQSKHWSDDEEKALAVELLKKEVVDLAIACYQPQLMNKHLNTNKCVDVNDSSDEEDFSFRLVSSISSEPAERYSDKSSVQIKIENEVHNEVLGYLSAIDGTPDVNPLEWWRVNRERFPSTARAARKWLCVPATSTPSERYFSIVNSVKQSTMTCAATEKQVFLHNNWYKYSA